MLSYDLANDLYRASADLSYSETKLLARNPAHFRYYQDNPKARTPATAQQFFGTLVHCAVLEPQAFHQRYSVVPDISKNSREWKDLQGYLGEMDLVGITAQQRDDAQAAAASVRAHPRVAPLLASGFAEVSCYWNDPQTRVACKGRLDWVHHPERLEDHPKVAVPLDLKTSADASRLAFAKSVINFEYHRQAHWYETGYALASGQLVAPMLFVVVESAAPFLCAAYTLDKWFMAQARKENRRLLDLYRHCTRMNDWPGYDPTITDLEAPRWALDDELRDERRDEERYAT